MRNLIYLVLLIVKAILSATAGDYKKVVIFIVVGLIYVVLLGVTNEVLIHIRKNYFNKMNSNQVLMVTIPVIVIILACFVLEWCGILIENI
jgi:Kef-type K+ transport system membrane component KefB